MVAGAGLYVFGIREAAGWIFAVGALAFVAMQVRQTYDGNNYTVRRLRKILSVSDFCFVLSALLMIENTYNFMLPVFVSMADNGYYMYLTYIHNNWVVVLLVAAIIQLYATHRISNELEKEAKKL